jgi:hypothetical protein
MLDWDPHPVPAGMTRAVLLHVHGFGGLGPAPLLVAWDDRRGTVRAADGTLLWYADESRMAYPTDAGIVTADAGLYPRGNRAMDALAVRSLEDLAETISAETVRSVDKDGVLHLVGEDDYTQALLLRSDETGIVLRAAGFWGTTSWTLTVASTGLLEGEELLTIGDVVPPTF